MNEVDVYCPKCGDYIYEYMPFGEKSQKVMVKCKSCGCMFEVTLKE